MLTIVILASASAVGAQVDPSDHGGLRFISGHRAESLVVHNFNSLHGRLGTGMVVFSGIKAEDDKIINRIRYTWPSGSPTKIILNIQALLFDYENGTYWHYSERFAKMANLKASLVSAGLLDKTAAVFIIDEPYYAGISRAVLETIITEVRAYFPGIPTHINFEEHCFDPEATPVNGRCTSSLAPAQRGVPQNIDWVSFDWYANPDSSCNGIQGAQTETSFNCRIRLGLTRLKAQTAKPILLIADGTDLYSKTEAEIAAEINRIITLARSDRQVIGVDIFAWFGANVVSFSGILNFPFALNRAISEGQYLLCAREGYCPTGSLNVPEGVFTWKVGEQLGSFYSNGSSFCGVDTLARWATYAARTNQSLDPADASVRRVPYLPNWTYTGVCN